MTPNYLSFIVPDSNSSKLILIQDTSIYQDIDSASGFSLQILVPGYEDAIELNYYKQAITVINSNLLKLTNVNNPKYFSDLPDGVYTAKISICPYEDNWFQKSWYRTEVLQCKYYKAFLNLKLDKCETCYNRDTAKNLSTIWTYIQGIHANVIDANFKKASELYSVANGLVDNILNCDECK